MQKDKKGFVPVMLTPFNANGSIDFNGLTKLTEFYLEAGASGLFANCLSSEMFELSNEERLALVKHIVQVSEGKVSIVATGTFGETLERQADFVKEVYETGVDAVIGLTCNLVKEAESDEVLACNVNRLLDLTENIPLGFYECPVPFKRLMKAELLGQVVATGRVKYYKDTSLDIENVKAKLDAVNGHEFGLYDAYMVHAVDSLKAGSKGLSCIQGNFFPELIVWLCENFDKKLHEDKVTLTQRFLSKNMEIMHSVYPWLPKYYLVSRGLDIKTFTRRKNIGFFDEQVKQQLKNLVYEYEELRDNLSI